MIVEMTEKVIDDCFFDPCAYIGVTFVPHYPDGWVKIVMSEVWESVRKATCGVPAEVRYLIEPYKHAYEIKADDFNANKDVTCVLMS